MLKLSDFNVGEKAYVLYLHTGYTQSPEIKETTVKKVGTRYVTVTLYDKKFERRGNVEALSEKNDFGEIGYLYNSIESAEKEMKRNNLIHNIRTYSCYLYKCSYEELRTIMDILKKASERK